MSTPPQTEAQALLTAQQPSPNGGSINAEPISTGSDPDPSVIKQLTSSVVRCTLLKVRKPVSCLVELLLPIAFIALLAWLSTLVKSKEHKGHLMVDPFNYDVNNLRDVLRNSTCLDRTGAAPLGGVDGVIDNIIDRCDRKPAGEQKVCGGSHMKELSPNLCLFPKTAPLLVAFFEDLEHVTAIPSMDEIYVSHYVVTEMLGPITGRFPAPISVNSMRALGKVFFSPNNSDTVTFVNQLQSRAEDLGFGLFNYGMYGGIVASQQEGFNIFTSLAGADTCLALVDIAKHHVPDSFDVTVSMNKSAVPWTNVLRNRFAQGAGFNFKLYLTSGFMSLQKALLETFNEETLVDVNRGRSAGNQIVDPFAADGNRAASVPMPYIAYKQQIFLELAGNMVPLALALSFLALVSSVAERLVQEKELRLREAMAAMGVSKTTLFFAWLVTYGMVNLIVALACTLTLHATFIKKSTVSLVFVLFLGCTLSTTALGSILSSFFSKSRTAAIATPILYFACCIPSFALDPKDYPGIIGLLQLLSPTAFSTGLRTIIDYEQNNGMGWDDLYNKNDQIKLGASMGMLYFDFFLYSFLTWYFDNVLAGEWGVAKHPLFCFMDCCRKANMDEEDSSRELGRGAGPVTISGVSEAYPESDEAAVNITRVTKEFGSGEDKKTAVSGVSLKIFPAMVTAVLGHNGAGKTTLFNMLTGMLPITRGDCFIYNESITSDPNRARRNIGMCPQHNILWDDLTCYEHLVYFAMVKGLPMGECSQAAERMLKAVDLESKRNARTASLSGGQKRKLSVAIAFIGGSKLVLLDEPTAGMDVHTRRHTWELIQRMAREEQRAIILTTHFMDEAELLGDRVAMMAAGQLHSYGSTTFLKATLGQSYTLNVQYEHPPSDEMRAQLMKLVKSDGSIYNAAEKEARGREQAVTLPMEDIAKFAPMLQLLESRTREMNITSFSMSAATIEDVFVAIAHAGDHPEDSVAAIKDSFTASHARLVADRSFGEASRATSADAAAAVMVQPGQEDSAAVASSLMAGDDIRGTSTNGMTQLVHLMKKRFHNAKRDKRALVLQVALPIICIVLAMALANLKPPGTPSANLSPFQLPDDQEAIEGGCSSEFLEAMRDFIQTKEAANDSSTFETATWLQDTYNKHGGFDRVSALQCLDSSQRVANSVQPMTVLFSNTTAFAHAAPWAQQLWYMSRVQMTRRAAGMTEKPSVSMSTEPLPFTLRERTTIDTSSYAIMALFIVVPFSFVPSTFTGFVVKERASKAKLLQFVSGVGYFPYWLSNFFFDLASYLVTMVLAIIIFAIFGRDEYIGTGKAFFATLILFLLYGFAAIPTSYVMSLAFTNHSTAQNAVLGVFFLAGFGLTLAGFLLQVLDGPVGLLYLFRLFPPACLGEGLMTLANAPGKEDLGQKVALYGMEELGWPLLYLGLIGVVMALVILFVDHPERTKRQQMLSYKSGQTAPAVPGETPDVAAERQQVEQGTATGDDAFLRVLGLRKEYPAPAGSDKPVNVAVQNLTFHVPKGEIFGLLGTNGAGKTTTMNVITGETLPTMGEATVSGHNVVSQAGEARQVIGYCPQFDALHDLMTVDEHLALYCGLRGVSNFDNVATSLCTALGLTEYRRILSKSLSGGNRRKLSVALSLLGAPRLLLLDEPTAGMDPVARRSMCDVVSAVSKHCAVVLTTHHLEEVEALADRAAIMVAGKMQCLGTLEHLKATLGEGYQVSIRIANESTSQNVSRRLDASYPGQCKLVEQHQTRLRFNVKQGASTTLSGLFALLHEMKTSREAEALGVLDYTVSQSSVEEVFLAVAGGNEPQHDPDTPLDATAVSPKE